MYDGIKKGSNAFCHFQQLQNSGDSEHSHDSNDRWIDGQASSGFQLVKEDADDRKYDDDDVQLIPSVLNVAREAESYDAQDGLDEKHNGEHEVQVVEDLVEDVGHEIELQGHGDHVEADDGRDYEVEVFAVANAV